MQRRDVSVHKIVITVFARWGYASRGTLYLLVGGLALMTVFGQGGEKTDSLGALESILTAPLGRSLLRVFAIGLLGYCLWTGIQAILDTENHGRGVKGIAARTGLLISSLAHLLLAGFALTLITTLAQTPEDSGNGSEGVASWLIDQPAGRWLLVALGIGICGAGIAHALKGWKTKFHADFDMPRTVQRWTYPICRFGLAVRGIVFLMIGVFFITAGYQVDPDEAGGMTDVFSTLQSQAFGPWLLTFVAVGLISFGLYGLLEAIFRKVNI